MGQTENGYHFGGLLSRILTGNLPAGVDDRGRWTDDREQRDADQKLGDESRVHGLPVLHFESQAALLKRMELELGRDQGYVFIDEIQRKEDSGLFLKGLFDLKLPHKFIVSGSGSLELKERIHESLVGRKRLFELSTITFEEFIHHRTDYRYEKGIADFLAIEPDRALQLLAEYRQFGGYPRVVMAAEEREKRRLIDEIYRSVLEKDIAYLLKLDVSCGRFRPLIPRHSVHPLRLIPSTDYDPNRPPIPRHSVQF